MTDTASSETTTCTEREVKEVAQANATSKQPVVFVHGLWLLPSSWDRWREVFEEAGYVTLASGWPNDPHTVEEAKEHPEVFAHQGLQVRKVGDRLKRPVQLLLGHQRPQRRLRIDQLIPADRGVEAGKHPLRLEAQAIHERGIELRAAALARNLDRRVDAALPPMALERKPAVLGYSFGGLLTQILAGRRLCAASVAIDAAPFRGVLPLLFSALKSSSPS